MNTNVLVGEEAFTATIIHDFAGPRTPHDAEWAEGRSLADLGIELKNFEPVCVPPRPLSVRRAHACMHISPFPYCRGPAACIHLCVPRPRDPAPLSYLVSG